jgi:hypothetical protein
MGNKRTKQLSKNELLSLIEIYGNDKKKIADHLGVGQWSLREQLKRNNINFDKRIETNKNRRAERPPREELIRLYEKETMLNIAKMFNVSNVTVSNWLDQYGIEKISHSDTIKNKVIPKIIESNKEKYGCEHFYQSETFKEKSSKTMIERYGVPFYPVGNTSKSEIEVLDFFNSLDKSFEKKRFFGIELDGYSEKLKIGFEYCGLYWHKETNKGKDLHRKKYDICKENGIRLFTIFEDEWLNRQNQVKGFIKAALNKNENRLFARNLKLFKLEKNDKRVIKFLEDNHIQGKSPPTMTINHYVLMKDDEIISSISLGKHHRNSKEIVINRYCTKSNYIVIGGSRKLFSHVLKDYEGVSIKTWSDNRWTEGDLYKRLNFNLISESKKDYSYVFLAGKNLRKSKQSMTKKNTKASPNQTEYERALELGFDRIWDCGKKTWVYNNYK